MTERELFLEWHYNQYLSENPNIDLSNAKYIYDYAHTHAMVGGVRENLFIAWQAATQREGFKFVPVKASEEMIESADPFGHVEDIYRQMIEAYDEQ